MKLEEQMGLKAIRGFRRGMLMAATSGTRAILVTSASHSTTQNLDPHSRCCSLALFFVVVNNAKPAGSDVVDLK